MGTNADSQVNVNIKPARVLHFSDGVLEEVEEKAIEDTSAPKEHDVNPKTLSWGPWFSHYAQKSGSSMLNAVDYAGESLASLFGITTPKYQIEINEFERVQEERKKMEEDATGWIPKTGGGDIPLVLNEPSREVKKSEDV